MRYEISFLYESGEKKYMSGIVNITWEVQKVEAREQPLRRRGAINHSTSGGTDEKSNVAEYVWLWTGWHMAVFLCTANCWAYNWITNPANGHRYALTNSVASLTTCEDEAKRAGGHLVAINTY